jgi:hypothetical protein
MGPSIFLIAIMGCGDGGGSCHQVRMLEARYESRAACTAATTAALTGASDVDAPVIVAQCVAAGQRASVRGADVKLPGPGRANLRVSPLRS